jgi:hypothetical protein
MRRVLIFLVSFIVLPSTLCVGQEFDDVLNEEERQAVDTSVEKGLAWLAAQQQRDGSFPTMPHGQPGVTSLCVMAFMSHGHLPGEGEYGEQLDRALKYVINCQKPSGLIALVAPAGKELTRNIDHEIGNTASYNHPISALMLSEAYSITGGAQADDLSTAIENALKVTLQMQQFPKGRSFDEGGWRYLDLHNDGIEADLSVTGWHLMFLRSAKNAGFDVASEPIDSAVKYVTECFHPQFDTFTYTAQKSQLSRGMAGAGILALAHAGMHQSPQADAAGKWILQYPFTDYNREVQFGPRIESKDRYHYALFNCSQGMYQLGDKYWSQFFPPTAQTLINNQKPDGSWPPDNRGSDTPFGQTYTTSLVILSLGAPNQLLPIFQR